MGIAMTYVREMERAGAFKDGRIAFLDIGADVNLLALALGLMTARSSSRYASFVLLGRRSLLNESIRRPALSSSRRSTLRRPPQDGGNTSPLTGTP